MPRNRVKIAEVFQSMGQPLVTYVKHGEGLFENALRSCLETVGQLCLITGPSKTGKTTLYSTVCDKLGSKPLIIRCNENLTASDIWKQALEQVEFERIFQIDVSQGRESSGKGELSGKIGWSWLAGASGVDSN